MFGIHRRYIAIFRNTTNSTTANPVSRMTMGIHHMVDCRSLTKIFSVEDFHQY